MWCWDFILIKVCFLTRAMKKQYFTGWGKIATNDISKNLSFVGYMKEGKHEITIESGKSGKSSVEFNVSRTGANVYTYALKHTKTKVDITATNYNYFSFHQTLTVSFSWEIIFKQEMI